jgi:hypothetical protein
MDQESAHIIHRYTKERVAVAIIAAEIGRTPDHVYEILRRNNIPRDLPGGAPKTDENIRLEILRRYQAGEGATLLAREMGVSKKTVYNMLVRAGIGTRPVYDRTGTTYTTPESILAGVTPTGRGRGTGKTKQKDVNENAFAELTPEAAYWVGYLMCDGHILRPMARTNLKLMLRQSEKNVKHLESFKSFIQSKHKITHGTHLDPAGVLQEHCVIALVCMKLCQDLIAYGIDGLKPTRYARDPRLLNNRHFWRGCVDADGCVQLHTEIYLSGHQPLLDQYEQYVLYFTGEKPRRNGQPGCFVSLSSARASRILAKELYQGDKPVLPEKQRRASAMIQ